MTIPQCNIMIGISTAQNTTNLVPFIQFNGQTLVLLETNHAKKQKWAVGIQQVVQDKGKKIKTIYIDEGSDIANTLAILQKKTKQYGDSICWNIGGGQKAQTLPLILTFYDRIKAGNKDWACYSEPQTRKTSIITSKNQKISNKLIPTNADLSLSEIVLTFNYKIKQEGLKCLWTRKGGVKNENILTKSDMEFFLNYDKRQKMFQYTFDVWKKKEAVDRDEVFPDNSKDFGEYFEKIVQAKTVEIMANNSDDHKINEIWGNVEVSSKLKKDTKQEFDVVLVTNFGTLLPIDAKTYEFKKKDEEARKYNLRHVSGVYTEFWSIFPFMKSDLEPESILQTNKEWGKLLNRPFELDIRGSKMLVYSEDDGESFQIIRKKGVVKVGNGKGELTLHPLRTFIQSLNLQE